MLRGSIRRRLWQQLTLFAILSVDLIEFPRA
jgi:hypothetical protein